MRIIFIYNNFDAASLLGSTFLLVLDPAPRILQCIGGTIVVLALEFVCLIADRGVLARV